MTIAPPLQLRARQRAIARKLDATVPFRAELTSLSSYAKRLASQQQLAQWLWEREFDFMVTLNSNDFRCDYHRGRTALKKFDALINRHLLGKRWYKSPSEQRTLFLAVPEHAGGELHYHVLLKLPPKAKHNPLRARRFLRSLTQKIRAKKIFPHGDAHVLHLTRGGEIEICQRQFCTACYVVKRLWRSDEWENYVLSKEFHP
jgi:hypothetical protein